jgi:hypothetical protein
MKKSNLLYVGGEQPQRGDILEYAEVLTQPIPPHREQKELWVVIFACGDMVRCKALDAPAWKQAHYIHQMRLVQRANSIPLSLPNNPLP